MAVINALPKSGTLKNPDVTKVHSVQYNSENQNRTSTFTATEKGLYYAGLVMWDCFNGGSRSLTTTGTRLYTSGTLNTAVIENLVWLEVGQTITGTMNGTANRCYKSMYVARVA